MKAMKKVLYTLMMIAMLTPALVCGSFICAKPAQAMEDMPCHGEKQDDNEKHSLMFMKDCLKVELLQAGHGDTFQKPDIDISKVVYGAPDLLTGYNFEPVASYNIRGPPTETVAAGTYPPVYLTTQRLRI